MKLSIITINFNNKKGLEKTMLSVFAQKYQDLEYIVIDGGSTDGSKEIIQRYENEVSYWISESDTGIYNAMNKGIKKAQGEFLLFLNSGDWLFNTSNLEKVMSSADKYDILYADQYIYHSDGTIRNDVFPDTLVYSDFAYRGGLPHQATVIRASMLKENGCYDETYRMVSDWKFFLVAIFKWHCRYKHIPIFLSCYTWGGFSSNIDNDALQQTERNKVIKTDFPNFFYVKEQMIKYENLFFVFRYSKFIRVLKFLKLIRVPHEK